MELEVTIKIYVDIETSEDAVEHMENFIYNSLESPSISVSNLDIRVCE